jgi:ssDNA-binding Zn-finger/Zn-ribbon topoisomerase 1
MNASHLPAIDKLCPECGRPLAIRTNTKNHSQFLGCTGYPECSHTEAIPETLRLRLLGHPELPLFEAAPAPVVWGRTRQGKRCPYNVVEGQPTQESHFLNCPHSRAWSKS